MNIEIERKFLVSDRSFEKEAVEVIPIVQGYICAEKGKTVRIRRFGDKACITIKGGARAGSIGKAEYEYAIPTADAEAMLDTLCGLWIIRKERYIVPYENFIWEVDVFHGRHEGLVVAEIELPKEDTVFKKPAWVDIEVTGDGRYSNAALSAGNVF